jgi:2'-hydroxyisoflavone reductase
MTTSRREFLETGLAAGAAMAFFGRPGTLLASNGKPLRAVHPEPEPHPLNILILGGTSMLGPHIVAYAMGRGHTVTTFTRGRTKPTVHQDLFHHVEQLIGDRESDLEALKGRSWDAVIDNSGYRVKWARDSAELLRDSADLYLYTSSIGVYYPYRRDILREDDELNKEVPAGELSEVQQLEYGYAVMKTLSEIEVVQIFGEDRTILSRPTYMVGPGDRTDRFTYWPVRLPRGGEILVPGRADDPVQFIDARDVAGFMVRLIEGSNVGAFNVAGPASPTGMHAFVYGAHAAFSTPASFVSIPDYDFLLEHEITEVVPWILPTGDNYGSARANIDRALANGLTFTPLAGTVRDIHEWWHSGVISDERKARMISGEGSLMAREAGIISAWKARG